MGLHRVRHDWSDLAAAAAALSNFRTKEKTYRFASSKLLYPTIYYFLNAVCLDTICVSLTCMKVTCKNYLALDYFLKQLDYTLNTITKTLALSQSKWWEVRSGCQVLCMLADPDLMDSERRYFKTMIWLEY